MQIFLKKLSILGLILIISACGFQLRGDINANFDSISISGGTSSFNKTLQRKFRQAGITITSASDAEKIVEIIKNSFTIFSASEAFVIVIPACLNLRWRVLLKLDVPPEIEIESKFALISPLN